MKGNDLTERLQDFGARVIRLDWRAAIQWRKKCRSDAALEGNIQGLVGEATELTSILAASAKTAKARSRPE